MHPWANLKDHSVKLLSANGDSEIPGLAKRCRDESHAVMALYDRDALSRRGEQADVIGDDAVEWHELHSDFEASFDPEIVQRALSHLGYDAGLDCLREAQSSGTGSTMDAIRACAQAPELGKVQLAKALAAISTPECYVPEEIYDLSIRLGEQCGVQPFTHHGGWSDPDEVAIEARGVLYASNHVKNDAVSYWDFDKKTTGAIVLPGTFDGLVSVCRAGRRFVARQHERAGPGQQPTATWVHVFDSRGDVLTLNKRFKVRGSLYDLRVEEDGNHLELTIQDTRGKNSALRCLADGTKREEIALPAGNGLYTPRTSLGGRLTASGPHPVRVADGDVDLALLRHFHGCAYTWSPCGRFLAFFGRRWPKHKSQDSLWIYDLRARRIHRAATGDGFIPLYWG